MRTLLASVCVMAFVAVTFADLLSILKQVHSSPSFSTLPHEEQLLLVEMIGEAEVDQLHAFVKVKGMDKIVALLDHLPEHEAATLLHYLNQELQQESHHAGHHGSH